MQYGGCSGLPYAVRIYAVRICAVRICRQDTLLPVRRPAREPTRVQVGEPASEALAAPSPGTERLDGPAWHDRPATLVLECLESAPSRARRAFPHSPRITEIHPAKFHCTEHFITYV